MEFLCLFFWKPTMNVVIFLSEKVLFCYPVSLCRGDNLNIFYIRSMADERKSLFKCPYRPRRSRKSTPDLFTPYLPGPELILPSPMTMDQTMPVFSVSRSCSNLSSASFLSRSSSFADSVAPFDLGLGPSSSGFLHTNPGVVEDLSIRSTTRSVFPSWMDWHGPPGPSISYTAPVPSGPTVSTSRDPSPGIQRFYQDFKLPNYPLDTFSGKLFDVASSTAFVTGGSQAQTSLCYYQVIFIFCCFTYIDFDFFCKDSLYLKF